jgi:hypothetical protein
MPGEITSDNLHLSETIRLDQTKNCSDVCNPPTAIDCPDPAVLRFVQAATAANTRRAYHSDLEHFLAWGGCLPATDRMVARYLADHLVCLQYPHLQDVWWLSDRLTSLEDCPIRARPSSCG